MFSILTSGDIHKRWTELMESIERCTEANNGFFDKRSFLLPYSVSILAFYGLSVEQILSLKLSDISPDGIRGYHLPMQDEDIRVLMKYKEQTYAVNGRPLIGDTFARTVTGKVDALSLNRALTSAFVEEEYQHLKRALTWSAMLKIGAFDRIYRHEKETGEYISEGRSATPQWFRDQIMRGRKKDLGANRLIELKHEYTAYRAERTQYEIDNAPSETVPEKSLDSVLKRLLDSASEMQSAIIDLVEILRNDNRIP